MCGRYSQSHSLTALEEAFNAIAGTGYSAKFATGYNIAPGREITVVRNRTGEGGTVEEARELTGLHWGLVPGWMKERPKSRGMINARAETVASKPSFRAAYKRRRCLVPADGFFEWKKEADNKQPWYIQAVDGQPLTFAGLWEHWHRDGQEIESCAIITTSANADMQAIHDRMPVIIRPKDYGVWLDKDDADENTEMRASLLRPFDNGLLRSCTVSTYVNNPRNNDVRCLEALA